MATRKKLSKAPNSQEAVRVALRELWRACKQAEPGEPTIDAISMIADAMEHARMHRHGAEIRKLANKAHAYMKGHRCFVILEDGGLVVSDRANPIVTPRHVLLKALVNRAAEHLKAKSPPEEMAEYLDTLLVQHAERAELPPPPKGVEARLERTTRAVKDALTKHSDVRAVELLAEHVVVAALVGWGLTRKRAREHLKSAKRRAK